MSSIPFHWNVSRLVPRSALDSTKWSVNEMYIRNKTFVIVDLEVLIENFIKYHMIVLSIF